MSLTENLPVQNFGRELVFSADLCYNGTNEKPPSEREVARRSRDGGSLRDLEVFTSFVVTHSPSPAFVGSSLPEGALGIRATLGVWASPYAHVACNAVIQRRNWR